MAKPKYTYTVNVERVVKVPYEVVARNEKEALRIIKKNAKEGGNPADVATLGEVQAFGKLVRPAHFEITQGAEVTAE